MKSKSGVWPNSEPANQIVPREEASRTFLANFKRTDASKGFDRLLPNLDGFPSLKSYLSDEEIKTLPLNVEANSPILQKIVDTCVFTTKAQGEGKTRFVAHVYAVGLALSFCRDKNKQKLIENLENENHEEIFFIGLAVFYHRLCVYGDQNHVKNYDTNTNTETYRSLEGSVFYKNTPIPYNLSPNFLAEIQQLFKLNPRVSFKGICKEIRVYLLEFAERKQEKTAFARQIENSLQENLSSFESSLCFACFKNWEYFRKKYPIVYGYIMAVPTNEKT
uniref:hypothetical protein n=1 Tax=Gormaniella terricola TaxID=2904618 RepID=UPI0021CD0957|nr:hypothetical protein ODF01_pgp003 [Gormaniella terricola]UWV18303.1 hypothetical protein [Gormaniella terricola]